MTHSGSPQYVHRLEEKLAAAQANGARLTETNDRLIGTLKEARSTILSLKEEIDRLAAPPSGYGVFLRHNDDGTADVFTGGRELRVGISPEIDLPGLRLGQRVLLNDALNVVRVGDFERTGEVVELREILPDGSRALVESPAGEERIVHLAGALANTSLRAGDSLLIEPRGGYAFEQIPKSEVGDFVLDEVPDLAYGDIGGLDPQIEQIRHAIETPFLHAELFQRYELHPPKGVLLYGPPGCGKTLIAKAVANSLAKQMAARRGDDRHTSYFLNVKGPELLDKYVGETERRIRLVFQRARDKAAEGAPVIVFFDEMDALFRTRGSGISSDMESTAVPQLLTEIDGVEPLGNVIVIGASNREELIDPAITRPGRLDVKIRVGRPNAVAAMDIFARYLTPTLPLHAEDLEANGADSVTARISIIRRVVQVMYAEDPATRFAEVTFQSGVKQDIYFSHFISGAIIRSVVDRAKLYALLRNLQRAEPGIGVQDLLRAVVEEMRSIQDLANTTNSADWSRISGARGEHIAYVRTVSDTQGSPVGKAMAINPSPSR